MDPRVKSTVSVIGGERELFRRQLNYLAIVYVVAHEYAHALERRYIDYFWPETSDLEPREPSNLNLKSVMKPRSEEEEVGSGWHESLADSIAYRIMSSSPLIGEQLTVVTLIAPAIVMGLQSALWWQDRAEGKSEFGWSHPLPDLRMWGPLATFAPDETSTLHREGKLFLNWLYGFLRLGEARSLAIEQAKRGTGDTMNRVYTLMVLGLGEGDE